MWFPKLYELLARGAIYEKLIFNKEKENMTAQLEKSFKGFIIPPLADTPEGREAVRKGHQGNKDYCFLSDVKCMTHECIEAKRRCSDCIACLNCGDARRKREVFKEYDRLYPAKGKGDMPELKSGMIVEHENGDFFFLEERRSDKELFLVMRFHHSIEGVVLTGRTHFTGRDLENLRKRAVRVYADVRFEGEVHHFIYEEIVSIVTGKNAESGDYVIWKKPDPVKEMTVDEISKALGYKVKVVGNEV